MTKTIPSHETRRCTKCCAEKPISEFQKENRIKGTKFLARCRVCTYSYQREWRNKNPDQMNEKYRHWRRNWLSCKTAEELKAYRNKASEYARNERQKIKDEVLSAYGGKVCACCGENEMSFLSIDHINNDGYEKRKNGIHPSGGTAFYRWLLKNGCPKGFQVLCMNCQFGKKNNKGICPHQIRGVTTR